jgi:Ras-related protein Rab-8A
MGILLVYDVTDERSFNSTLLSCSFHLYSYSSDIRTWHANIEQHASEGVNKILIGNKSDWVEKKAVTEEQGRDLANEFGIRFLETSAKVNEGVEEAFFTLARYLFSSSCATILFTVYCPCRDIKTRLIDSQPDAAASPGPGGSTPGERSVNVNQPQSTLGTSCCS